MHTLTKEVSMEMVSCELFEQKASPLEDNPLKHREKILCKQVSFGLAVDKNTKSIINRQLVRGRRKRKGLSYTIRPLEVGINEEILI